MCPMGRSQALPVVAIWTFLSAYRGSANVKFMSQLCIAESRDKSNAPAL